MSVDSALAELVQAAVAKAVAPLVAEMKALRAERQHAGGRWASRSEAAQHHGRSVDWIGARLADKSIRGRKLGPEPEERRDVKGRRIDRRRWEVWVEGLPKTDAEVERLAEEARRG